jgi:hypothetical protein
MFLEEFFIRGMSLKDATGMVIDMLMAGIDTVLLEINSSPKSQLIIKNILYADVTHYFFPSIFLGKESRKTRKIETRNSFSCGIKRYNGYYSRCFK